MNLAMSNIAWPPELRLTAYEAMTKIGVTGLEIAPGMLFFRSRDPFSPSKAEARQALSEVEAAGLRLVSMQALLYGVEGAELFGDGEGCERFAEGMSRAIDLAGELSIPNLVFGSPRQRAVPGSMTMDRAQDKAARVFLKLGDRAAGARTVISIEANPIAYGTNFLNSHAQTLAFVRRLGHPAIRLNLDLGAVALNQERIGELLSIVELSSWLNHVHVSEPHLEPAPSDRALLSPVLAELRAMGYKHSVSVEMKQQGGGLEVIKRSLTAFRSAATAAGLP